jgi:hypothetical protein
MTAADVVFPTDSRSRYKQSLKTQTKERRRPSQDETINMT